MDIVKKRADLPNGDDIYIFGASRGGRIVLSELAWVRKARVTGFIDNRKRGQLKGRPIFSLDEFLARRTERSLVVIASAFAAEITGQLRSRGVEEFCNAQPLIDAILWRRHQGVRWGKAMLTVATAALLLWWLI